MTNQQVSDITLTARCDFVQTVQRNPPYFFFSQSSGMGQYLPVGSTSPSVGTLLGLPNLLRHLRPANLSAKNNIFITGHSIP